MAHSAATMRSKFKSINTATMQYNHLLVSSNILETPDSAASLSVFVSASSVIPYVIIDYQMQGIDGWLSKSVMVGGRGQVGARRDHAYLKFYSVKQGPFSAPQPPLFLPRFSVHSPPQSRIGEIRNKFYWGCTSTISLAGVLRDQTAIIGSRQAPIFKSGLK